MKKLFLIITVATMSLMVEAQTHFPKSINIELGAGVNDALNPSPVIGGGYVFNNWLSLYGRYSLATGKVENNLLTYWEHNAEVYPAFTVYSYHDKWFISTLAGIIYKHQELRGIPVPSRDVNGHNFGGVIGVEGEWHFARFLSAYAGVSYRGLFFKEETRLEPFGMVGIRMSTRVFKKPGKI
ncbi:hypothetical protein FACS1894199_02890 [Bacteroidia bacterium]|nr:hypothetical protein FACS1894199_02890 [Bacteroidia bacterium]